MSTQQQTPNVENLMARLTQLEQAHTRMAEAMATIRAAAVQPQGAAAPQAAKSEGATIFSSSDSKTPAVQAVSNPGFGIYASGTSGRDANGNLVSGVGVYASGVSADAISGIGVYGSGTSGKDTQGNSIPGVGVYGANESIDTNGQLTADYGYGVHAIGTSGKDASGALLPGIGVYARSAHMQNDGTFASDYGHGVHAVGSSTKDAGGNVLQGYGVFGQSDNGGIGVYGKTDTGTGILGQTANGSGVQGQTATGTGVLGESTNGYGVYGRTATGAGVLGESGAGNGVHGITSSNSDSAVYAEHTGAGIGMFGRGGTQGGGGAHGVWGESVGAHGVLGRGSNAGVAAFNLGNSNAAYLASQCCAAWFTGDVHITGTLSKGGGQFLIDHPLDPANKFLAHAFVESSEMKNVYDGVVVLDEHGEAVVQLPAWFTPLNTNFRYQLTPIGEPGPNLYIAEEIVDQCFKIAGGTAGQKVCWQVTGTRQDDWAKAHPLQVESEKAAEERGHYLHPELHDASSEQGIEFVRHPKAM